jgi:signal transduction histidine kinase
VQAHHGSVEAGPTPGGGATFTVTLPRTEAHP